MAPAVRQHAERVAVGDVDDAALRGLGGPLGSDEDNAGKEKPVEGGQEYGRYRHALADRDERRHLGVAP